MIRKRNPNSDFWQAAEAASRRVDKYPPWKLGVLKPREPLCAEQESPPPKVDPDDLAMFNTELRKAIRDFESAVWDRGYRDDPGTEDLVDEVSREIFEMVQELVR